MYANLFMPNYLIAKSCKLLNSNYLNSDFQNTFYVKYFYKPQAHRPNPIQTRVILNLKLKQTHP